MQFPDNAPEEITILALFAIAVIGLLLIGVEAKELAIAVASGLIGYLKGKSE